MQHLDIDSLAVLIAVSRRQSFSAAAREIGRSQAAISFTVARLEEQVKVRLFERTPRGVMATPAGLALVTYALRIIALETEALKCLQGDVDHARVRLGLPDDYMDGLGSSVLSHFAAAWPRVQVEITCDFSRRLETLVAAGDLDIAVITRDRRSLAGEKLRDEPQVWCARHDTRPEREDVLPVALFSDQCRARPLIVEALEALRRPWRLAFTCSHLHGIYAAVERGALAVLPASCVPAHFRVVGPEDGLPDLPTLELALLVGEGVGVMPRRLARILRDRFVPDQVSDGRTATAA
ncbi:LysR family transcriptional regulator [Lichenifustis flavocetrariae]|uniref:LysR substrate-binding domain-containing protein n=1 Tax=Lichenifustis flavocetrariae TaxID=2949735 RepID=A0AA42CGL5_9HYPH|nr:LysR family transcriptional regulator [Lichenifustis flavocetrariae]MCW6506708.1 LysR substrate-binding domain-containing protein [Lichenifustis flavocetrariae]